MTRPNTEGLLSPYRVLDLTNERGFLCGKLLGDLGADVIKIERPGGDPARLLGPFYHDEPDPEKSLYWWAFNVNKRGITLDIDTADGQDIFKKLVKKADVVLESFEPGRLQKLRLGYDVLSSINPGIIVASITGFGQIGPYRDYKSSDLTIWALAGEAYVTGDPDRAPLSPSFPVSYFFAATSAAAAAVIALYQKAFTGVGQEIDAPAQLGVAWACGPEMPGLWEVDRAIVKRSGGLWRRAQTGATRDDVKYVTIPIVYPCKDGNVRFVPFIDAGMLPSTVGMSKWVIEEGFASETLKSFDWSVLDWQTVAQETMDEVMGSFSRFFLTHTKAELWEGAQQRGITLCPLLTAKGMAEYEQLSFREYWEEVEHPELETSVKYPGAFAKISEAPCAIKRRAPLIGEHNEEIYMTELGFSREELLALKQGRII
jgi:crotonobetainyl-CoA:carnitine CoA-transferase CaiB-like acyl-CoA transferase